MIFINYLQNREMVQVDARNESSSRAAVRILLVGESGVGKTSIILSLVSEEFPDDVPPRAEEITIPADVTPERIPTHIVDYSAQEQNDDALIDEINKANVICIVYSVDEEETIESIKTFWLPFIRDQLGEDHSTPVILVGNKTDLMEYDSLDVRNMFAKITVPIMNEFAEIETCVECSAKTLQNISELFYFAQKAVIHPSSPIYVHEQRDITDRCKEALLRIFKILDADNDGVLNDSEIDYFQRVCFDAPLSPQSLEDLKTVVGRNVEDGYMNDGITINGFTYLNILFIQRGRHETVWTVLRKFGYDNNLQLHKNYINPHLRVPPGSTTELTHEACKFLTEIFRKYDQDKDNCLSSEELENLFSTCPFLPWGPEVIYTVPTSSVGMITYKGYIAQWMLTTYIDVGRTMELLAYLGYNVNNDNNMNQLSAVQVTREKSLDMQKRQTSRNVFNCHVIGPKNAGKSSFLQGYLEHDFEQQKTKDPSLFPKSVINTVQVYGQEKYLIIHEIDVLGLGENLTTYETECDVLCLMYDISHPRSFEYIAKIYLKYFYDTKIPVLIVANKCDEETVSQTFSLQPEEFCNKYKLPPPQLFTAVAQRGSSLKREVYTKLATMAAYPNLKRMVHTLFTQPSPTWVSYRIRTLKNHITQSFESSWLKTTFGIAAVAALSVFVFKAYRSVPASITYR
ncbi:Mitochondrial Rho GTPase 1-A [Nymphon striatum]|nr:Mitochondrial Rho GTPase 1-A [Nymphon striatum]